MQSLQETSSGEATGTQLDDDGCGSEITLMAARFGQIRSSLLPTGLKEAMICVLGGLDWDWQVVKKVCLCFFKNIFYHFPSFSIQIFWPDMASLECYSQAAAQAGVCAAEAWDPD